MRIVIAAMGLMACQQPLGVPHFGPEPYQTEESDSGDTGDTGDTGSSTGGSTGTG